MMGPWDRSQNSSTAFPACPPERENGMVVVFPSPSALQQPPRPFSPSAPTVSYLGTQPYEKDLRPTVPAHPTSAFSRECAANQRRSPSNVHGRNLALRICRRDLTALNRQPHN